MPERDGWEVIIVGGGLAGLSAAVYLGRALRRTLVVDANASLAMWEPDVQNYLGFPEGIGGQELLDRGRAQVKRYGVEFVVDSVRTAHPDRGGFVVVGDAAQYRGQRLLLATGLYHLPPDIPGVNACLGHSMFFCKDCDAFRVQRKRIAIVGANNEAVEYGLGMLLYSSCVILATNGKAPTWDGEHGQWIEEYHLPVLEDQILAVEHCDGQVSSLTFENEGHFAIDAVFTTRGDVYHNQVAQGLGAELDEAGQIAIDACGLTSVPGLYAAGCVTPANCQMIVAAGQGATAAQAINRNLFEESLANHSLRRFRESQLKNRQTIPEVLH